MKPAERKPETPAPVNICRYRPQAERVLLWESVNGPVPPTTRVGWTCKVAYCEKLDHMRLVKKKNLHWHDYGRYARKVAKLKPGESCILIGVDACPSHIPSALLQLFRVTI